MITDKQIQQTVEDYTNVRDLVDLIQMMSAELRVFREVAGYAAKQQVEDLDGDEARNIHKIAHGLALSKSSAKLCLEAAIYMSDLYNGRIKID